MSQTPADETGNAPRPAVQVQIARTADILPRVPTAVDHWLSPSELQRYTGLHNDRRRLQYLSGHWLLRELLVAAHGSTPTGWPLQDRPRQPPSTPADEALSLSLSHSGDWIAAACAYQPIGIDIEQRRAGRSMAAFEALLLAEGEHPGQFDDDALLRRWVIKEAHIKRYGGSALPKQLAALQLRRAGAGQANVQMFGNDQVYVGVAVEDGAVQMSVETVVRIRQTWRVDGAVRS